MTPPVSRDAYFETGLAILADRGYSGLKLAEVCSRLGVTSGSFYHYFTNWSAFTHGLIDHWLEERCRRISQKIEDNPDPRQRIEAMLHAGRRLVHGAEAAIRVWSALDPTIREVQWKVDRLRFDAVYDAAVELMGNERQAQVFAQCVLYTVIGYEQATLPRDDGALAWIIEQLLDALDAGKFAEVPGH
ncbi:TetR/AcrR family transcriptional regulator [Mycobacterium sp. 1274756.6]|uniref:TetR/AcrR family transcriptional regulator n=1 Tax=Mycobacterium sp. 1274756.6 TaxID=1834076 RepID=UPI0007FF2110|nr:TetR/AcrR family transcriptional regulator [Mycobacterium sp. 1274756.6]OBJ67468.1 TetR family transcriptional regulator [Mycobacterium sp. 1274756.6]